MNKIVSVITSSYLPHIDHCHCYKSQAIVSNSCKNGRMKVTIMLNIDCQNNTVPDAD